MPWTDIDYLMGAANSVNRILMEIYSNPSLEDSVLDLIDSAYDEMHFIENELDDLDRRVSATKNIKAIIKQLPDTLMPLYQKENLLLEIDTAIENEINNHDIDSRWRFLG